MTILLNGWGCGPRVGRGHNLSRQEPQLGRENYGVRSGTAPVPENPLIVARLAVGQNREAFAVPENITTAQSFGPNHLVQQGAKLITQ